MASANAAGSGRGWRPPADEGGPARSWSRSTQTAVGRCPASYAARPERPSRYHLTSATWTSARWARSQAALTRGPGRSITVDDRRRGAGAETDRPRGRRPRHPGGLSAATPNSAPKRPDLSPRGRTATKVCPFGCTSRPVWVNITPQTSARQDQADGVTGTSEGDPSHLVGSLGAGAQDAADRTRVLRPLEIRGLDGLDQ